jgi:hypothetical protein
VALSYHSNFNFHVKSVRVDGIDLVHGPAYEVTGEVTCVALSDLAGETILLAGVWETDGPSLMVFPTQSTSQDRQLEPIRLEVTSCKFDAQIAESYY